MEPAKKLLKQLKAKVFTIFGDIRLYKYPLFLLYHPKGYKIKGSGFTKVADNIAAYDILLRRYDTYLDRIIIPGWWNHAAICEKADGAFSSIVHATSAGVHQESLFDFMKTDHVCVLRPVFPVNHLEMQHDIKQIIGKEYDFDFNFGDASAFSCTEVISYLFRNYQTGIESKKFLGQKIIPPDNIYNAPGFKRIA
jgi:hypothetical protein